MVIRSKSLRNSATILKQLVYSNLLDLKFPLKKKSSVIYMKDFSARLQVENKFKHLFYDAP